MRLSANKDDIGYIPEYRCYSAYLNGMRLHQCITADEELGVVYVHEFDHLGNLVFDENRVPTIKVLNGIVSIKKDR